MAADGADGSKARSQLKRILLHADMLRDDDAMGRDRSELSPTLRSVDEHPYTIFYYPHDDAIEIARVLPTKRDINRESHI